MPTDLRFARHQRLRKPAEFEPCFARGQRAQGRYFRLFLLPAAAPRLGLAVSRKVDSRAVIRNRIKRLVREHFRLTGPVLPCADMVVVALHAAAAATPDALRGELSRLWQRAAALMPSPPAGTMRDAVDPAAPSRDA